MYRKRRFGRTCFWGILAVSAAMTAGCSAAPELLKDLVPGYMEEKDDESRAAGITIEIVDGFQAEADTEEEPLEEEIIQAPVQESQVPLPPIETDEFYPGDIIEEEYLLTADEDMFFTVSAISDRVFARMDGNSYKEGCPVSREDLRYLRILHYDLSGNVRVGELVCHQSVSWDMLRIFRQLYEAEYPIEKVALIDDYGGDDNLSSAANNTSCFNYRTVAGSSKLSLHALGMAVDINPLYNPYVIWRSDGTFVCTPKEGEAYIDRGKDFPYKIDEQDLCCRLFREAGFTWGGSWQGYPDYMHFSRGSRPEQ